MKKIISIIISMILLLSCVACGDTSSSTSEPASESTYTPSSDSSSETPDPEPGKDDGIDLSGQTTMSDTVKEANRLANGVQAYYTDNDKTAYVIENKNIKLTHGLSGKKYVSSLTNSDGEEYLYNTLDTYVMFNGERYYGSNGSSSARVNTTKLGYYYYSSYMRDMDFDSAIPLYLEKGYHTYSDRLHQSFRIIARDTSNYVTEFGFELKLKKSNVASVEILNENGEKPALTKGKYEFDNVSYIGFDIAKAGVVGIITAGQGTKLYVEANDRNYVIRQYISMDGIGSGVEKTFANRLYTDKTHSFEGIAKAAAEESAPLDKSNVSVEAKDGAEFIGYNRLTGSYDFRIDGHGFNDAYFRKQQKKYFENITVKNAKDDRLVYISVKTEFPLEGAALSDSEKNMLLPVPLQVGKNFGHEKEEPIYNPSDAKYGETIMPLSVKSNSEYKFTVVNAYQKWGNEYDLKQLSSIEYYISYYHLSTGVSETNCIAPYYSAYSKGSFGYAWVLPDFRGCSAELWADVDKQTGDPQYNSVGTLYAPTSDNGATMGNYTRSDIKSSGLTYADLDYSYVSGDGTYMYTMRHVEMPQKDESRTYYTIDFTFLKDTTVDNKTFSIIGFDGRKGTYAKSAYLDENGEHKELNNPTSSGNAKLYKLNKSGSYFAYYGLQNVTGETGNFGCIVKDYAITVNGKKSDAGLAFLNDFRTNPVFGKLNYGSLTLDRSVSFKKGDTISVNLILLPFGTIGQTNCDNVVNVYNDSVKNAFGITAATGTAGSDTWIPTVKAENNVAEFTIKGGTSAKTADVIYAVKAQGFDKLVVPKIYEKVNGKWVVYNFATELGYDGYGVQCENGKLTYSFAFTQSAAGRTFKIVAE